MSKSSSGCGSRRLFIQMSGAPGSGKSTTASLLSQAIDTIVIDHDIIKSTLLSHNIPSDQAAKLAWSLDWALAESLLKQDRDVIIDSTCNYQEVLDKGTTIAQQYGYEYFYVECKLDNLELLDERLRQRVSQRSQRTGLDQPPLDSDHREDDPKALFRKWIDSPCRPSSAGNIIIVDSTCSPEIVRDQILERLLSPSGLLKLETTQVKLNH